MSNLLLVFVLCLPAWELFEFPDEKDVIQTFSGRVACSRDVLASVWARCGSVFVPRVHIQYGDGHVQSRKTNNRRRCRQHPHYNHHPQLPWLEHVGFKHIRSPLAENFGTDCGPRCERGSNGCVRHGPVLVILLWWVQYAWTHQQRRRNQRAVKCMASCSRPDMTLVA